MPGTQLAGWIAQARNREIERKKKNKRVIPSSFPGKAALQVCGQGVEGGRSLWKSGWNRRSRS